VPRDETPPRDSQQIIDEQQREIDRLRDDLRRREPSDSVCGVKTRN
jgi:hypothetical protein